MTCKPRLSNPNVASSSLAAPANLPSPTLSLVDPANIDAILADVTVVLVPLLHEGFTLVDPEHAPLILPHSWQAHWSPRDQKITAVMCNNQPARRAMGTCYLHRWILRGCKQVDHKNGNPLDNRRRNLRPATTSQNTMNRPARGDNTSGYKGVFRNGKNWGAGIKVAGRPRIWLGTFPTKELAALAYNAAAIEHHGEFARLNEVRI